MTKHLVRIQNNIRLRGEEGQGALEYIGILAVVALIISLAVIGFRGADIGGNVGTIVGNVFNLGGGAT